MVEQWVEYRAQAERFIELSRLASDYAADGKKTNQCNAVAIKNFETFESLAVAVNHGFAIELLLKGLISKKTGEAPKGHNLKKLLGHECLAVVKCRLENEWKGQGVFEANLEGIKLLFVDGRYFFERPNEPHVVNTSFTSYLIEGLKKQF